MNERECRRRVRERSEGICEVCGTARATNYQHRKARAHCSKRELWLPSNGLDVCGSGNATGCHGDIHQQPTFAYSTGRSVKSWQNPIDEPVALRYGLVLLDDAGGFTPALQFGGVS